MGIGLECVLWYEEMFRLCGLTRFEGLRICELGNQHIRKRARQWLAGRGVRPERVSKKHFRRLGFDHVSIDINGKEGALPLDLARPITDPSLLGTFDVLTNFGTSEHVADQYECFRNMHRLCKPGGVFLHSVPMTGYFSDHHAAYRYAFELFERLAPLCGYEMVDKRPIERGNERLVGVCMRKGEDGEFPGREQFERIAAGTIIRA